MTFLLVSKASLKRGPFCAWVVQIPYLASVDIALSRWDGLTSSMHFKTFSSLNDLTIKYLVSASVNKAGSHKFQNN